VNGPEPAVIVTDAVPIHCALHVRLVCVPVVVIPPLVVKTVTWSVTTMLPAHVVLVTVAVYVVVVEGHTLIVGLLPSEPLGPVQFNV
jgi:hypothetical protein